MRVHYNLALLALLSACTQVPELNSKIPAEMKRADFPVLTPLDETLGPPVAPADQAQKLEDQLVGRRSNLQAQAQKLRSPVVDKATRTRLKDGISQ